MLGIYRSVSNNIISVIRVFVIASLNIVFFYFASANGARAESSAQTTPQQVVSAINKCLAVGDAECVIGRISKEMPAYQRFEYNTRLQFEKKIKDTLVQPPKLVESVIDRYYGSSIYVNVTYLNMPASPNINASEYLFIKYVFFKSEKGWDLTKMDFKQTGDFPIPEW
ncbi:hypothetical protein FZC33_00360 [Labrys sp. KNU-23]|uniref:hypothetical protein n=1 Tax=Labrys sp. KNU-23 TaxID=2789216 RepID=UPI0011F0866B|nr:hypothetical protein [Labrys sp. KNU-23]QEN84780.1 hypothetical protein FZC33_00360 [Labrys sp. KNU-23]